MVGASVFWEIKLQQKWATATSLLTSWQFFICVLHRLIIISIFFLFLWFTCLMKTLLSVNFNMHEIFHGLLHLHRQCPVVKKAFFRLSITIQTHATSENKNSCWHCIYLLLHTTFGINILTTFWILITLQFLPLNFITALYFENEGLGDTCWCWSFCLKISQRKCQWIFYIYFVIYS